MEEIILNAEIREEKGKGPAARFRREGLIPAVAYGPKTDAIPIMVKSKEIREILRTSGGESSLIRLKIAKKGVLLPALIKEIQLEPVRENILHIDFYLISVDTAIKTHVKLIATGESPGVKEEGGILTFSTREIEIECLPEKIPENIEVDISNLWIHDMLRIKDLKIPEGIKILSDPELLVVNVVPPAKEEVVVEAAPEEVEEVEEKVEAEEKEKEEEKKEAEETEG